MSDRENTAEYRRDYNRGWRSSMNAVTSDPLEAADARGESEAWYDGWSDVACGREKWHRRDCQAHHNGPGGCGTA